MKFSEQMMERVYYSFMSVIFQGGSSLFVWISYACKNQHYESFQDSPKQIFKIFL